jgi:site-specific recombinase XerD
MAKSGINPKTLQCLMGHSDIAVTLNVYTHVGLEDAEKELHKMQRRNFTRCRVWKMLEKRWDFQIRMIDH